MRTFLAVLSALIIFAAAIPYSIDIIRGRARPSRSARAMLLFLIVIALFQQISLGSGLALALTVGETLTSVALIFLAVVYGVGGLKRLDIICYLLLAVDLLIWFFTKNAFLALHLTILADTIAFWPVIIKTWRDPKSETALWYWAGVIAPIFSILATPSFSYSLLIFPVYISVINAVEIILIRREISVSS